MLQRLTKKQISKLGKKASSYKSKQKGGIIELIHRPGWFKRFYKKDKNTIVDNVEYKDFRKKVTEMIRHRAKQDSKYKSQSGLPFFTPLDVKIILIYLLHEKEFSNVVKGLKLVENLDTIIDSPIITYPIDEPESAKTARDLYTKIFNVIFGMDIPKIQCYFNTDINKDTYNNWLKTHYEFLYMNKEHQLDQELLIEFLKYKLDGDGNLTTV